MELNERSYPVREIRPQMSGLACQIIVLYELPDSRVGIADLYQYEDGYANIPSGMGDWQKVPIRFSDEPSQITMNDRFIPHRFLEPERTVTIIKEVLINRG